MRYVLALWPACHNDGARQSAKKMPKTLILLPNLEAIILISNLASAHDTVIICYDGVYAAFAVLGLNSLSGIFSSHLFLKAQS